MALRQKIDNGITPESVANDDTDIKDAKKNVNKGLGYEDTVKRSVNKAAKDIKGLSVSSITGGGNQNTVADLLINFNRKRYGVEIKLDARAPLGNPAVIDYYHNQGKFEVKDTSKDASLDPAAGKFILDAMNKKRSDYSAFISYVQKSAPQEYHQTVNGFPVQCFKDTWEGVKGNGLLKNLNNSLKYDMSIVSTYYASKDTYYIQIGGAGFFYLSKNPMNLDIPQLKGEVVIEVRAKSRGAKPRVGLGVTVVTGVLTAIPRLVTKNVSPYSLDNPDDVRTLFGESK
jgi:hypothetical protein